MKYIGHNFHCYNHHTTTTVLTALFPGRLGEPVPEENFWTLGCKGRSTEAETPTIRWAPLHTD